MDFRAWLEAHLDYRQQIQEIVVKKVRELLKLSDKLTDEDILDQDLSILDRKTLVDIIREGNRKNLDKSRLQEILNEIKPRQKNSFKNQMHSGNEYPVSKLVEKLDEDRDSNVEAQQKTYAPKTPGPGPSMQPPAPQAPAGAPPSPPQAMGAMGSPAIPPQM